MTWPIYIFDALIGIGILGIWAFFMRWKYERDIRPSKKYPNGQLVCEYWPETGYRYKRLLPIENNGIEVKAPKGHTLPRYFFNREYISHIRYPDSPILGLTIMQVPAPSVLWPENNPEPVNPYATQALVTSTMISALRDEDFLAFAHAASEEIAKLQTELTKALATRLNKMVVYILLMMSSVGGIGGMFIGYSILQLIHVTWGV